MLGILKWIHIHSFFLFPTGELPLSCRHLNSAISATIHELYIHLDNATRFCAIVEGKQFKRDEHNGLNELVEFVGKCILEEIFQWIECKEVENLSFKDINVDQLSDVLGNYANDFFCLKKPTWVNIVFSSTWLKVLLCTKMYFYIITPNHNLTQLRR